MAAKKEDYNSVKNAILQGDIKQVYLLQGDESYYIDDIMNLLLERLSPAPEDQDFDMQQFFGGDQASLGDVMASCRQYPMMSQYRLVTVREMQAFDKRKTNFDHLLSYMESPNPTTVLVMTYKGGNLGSVKVVNAVKKVGVVMQSDKIAEYNLAKELPEVLLSWGFKADREAVDVLCNYVGNDLAKMYAEMEKVRVAIQGNSTSRGNTPLKVTREQVASIVGISKEYNVWQLTSAIANRDLKKIEMIRLYFERNPKAAPMPMLTASLFGFLQNIMLGYYCQDKTPQGMMREIGCSYPAARDLQAAMKWCNAWKALDNISILREFDARSKGQRGGTTPDSELMKELFYRLTH